MPVLADLEREDLVEQAIFRQRQLFEPSGFDKLSKDAKLEEEKIQEAMIPLGLGLLSILRLGTFEQRTGQEGRYCKASRAAIRSLKEIKAAGVLVVILASWTGKTFDATSLTPGALLDALLDLGVDEVLGAGGSEAINKVFAEWLCRASEAGFAKAWPTYGWILSREWLTGVEFNPRAALKWLRKSHEGGDANGSLELALLMMEKPGLATEVGEGERLLCELAKRSDHARYELGQLLLKGEGLPKDEPGGLDILLSLAEAGHSAARSYIGVQWLVVGPKPHISLPPWAVVFKERLKAIYPGMPFETGPE
jgi:hypothetical protein